MKSITVMTMKVVLVNALLIGVAHAYLDPGAGSALIQGILAALAALVVTAKLYWHRLLRLFGIRKPTEKPTQNVTSESQDHSQSSKDA